MDIIKTDVYLVGNLQVPIVFFQKKQTYVNKVSQNRSRIMCGEDFRAHCADIKK